MTLLEMTIMGIISEEPTHAYNVEKVIEDRKLRDRMDIGFSTIYSSLKKMEKRGWVESSYEPQKKLPGKKIYSISYQGTEILREDIKKSLSLPQKQPSMFETSLSFAEILTRTELVEVLSIYEAELSRLIQSKVKEITQLKTTNPVVRALYDRPLKVWQSEKKWIKELLVLI